ncbi:uncharacterized protein K441DRAFT_597217, partial [Cenococcum geophilum 1.58]
KNKKRNIWEGITLKVAKRKRYSKESEVWIGRDIVPVKKLRKELWRYGYKAAFPYRF